MTEEKDLVEATTLHDSFVDLMGMKFNDDGSLSTATKIGNTPMFKKMNRKQRRANGIYSHKFQKTLKRI